MEDQKILNTEDVNWYEDDESRLDYEVAFDTEVDSSQEKNGAKTNAKSSQEHIDIKALLRENDKKWKKRLHKAREAAFSEGLEKGRKEGFKQAEEEIDEKLQNINQMLLQAHEEWENRHRSLTPGLLDLVFEMVEQIVGIPVEDPRVRETMEEELSVLLHKAENKVKPVLKISESDHEFIEDLLEKHAPELSVNVQVDERFNTGEFEFETEKRTVVHSFKEILHDFRQQITLPSWK